MNDYSKMNKNSLNGEVNKPEKKIDPVIKSKVTKKKKGLGDKLIDAFIENNNGRDIKDYLLSEIIIPAVKNTIYSGVTGALSMSLFGEYQKPTGRLKDERGYTSYSSISNRNTSSSQAAMHRQRMGGIDIADILIPTKWEAEEVLNHMSNILEQYSMVSVADYYSLVNEPHTPIDNNWGWDNLSSAYIQRCRGGEYRIILPRVISLR